jgi:YD repeat-containing protein
VEVYDAAGFPSSIKNQQGIGWTFQYDGSHYLTRVTHTSGRHVDFTWVNGLLTRVTDPAGDSYQYTYKTLSVSASSAVRAQPATTGMRPMMLPPLDPGQDDPPPAPPTPPIQSMVALLIGTIQPGIMPTRIVYHYEDSRFQTALTGKTINDARFSWISYNADGRAIETKLAGGVERYQFAYTLDTGGNISITGVTNPLGKVTDYAFDIKGNQLSISEKASAHCAAAAKNRQYDSNVYLSSSTDFLGRVTNYTFNAKGQLLQLVENANADPAQRRTTSYAWDDYNRVVKETLAGDHETTYVYGGDNRLALVTVKNLSDKVPASAGQVRTTTYTYATWPNGLVSSMTIDGPLPGNGDALVATYSQTGDLLSTRNSFGQTTTYGNYNGLGLPGDITGPNGDKHAFIYDARGRVIDEQTFRNGSTQHTYYEYDAFGRLAKETRPDGQYHGYQYDGAGRLVSEYEPEAGGTFAQTVYAYNAMSLPVSVKKQRAFVEPPRGTVP